ncbi:MAG TPA: transposase [Ktedonobacteraceae bacterium]
MFDLRLQQWVRVDWWSEAADNGKEHVLTLVEQVQAGALLLFDRGYLSFAFFDALTQRSIRWISRYGNQVSDQMSPVCSQADGVLDAIVFLGTHPNNQARYPVRLIPFWRHGRHFRSLTNVLDPQVLPLADVVGLYARRWDIELAFRALKDHLNLHHLWSAKPAVVQVQLWCCLILAQVYHALPVEIAGQTGVEVFDVSLDLLVRLTPGWLSRGLTPLEHAVRFGRDLGLLRPSTRLRIQVPRVDPCWGVPPPAAAVQPRAQVRHRSYAAKGTGTKGVGRVRLKHGKLHLLELVMYPPPLLLFLISFFIF